VNTPWRISPRVFIQIVSAVVACAVASPAKAQRTPSYGHDFVTVGAPGNRGTLPSERPWAVDPEVPYGAVKHEFRITRTEILNEQWFEFVQAYAPFYPGSPRDKELTGLHIRYTPGVGHQMFSGTQRFPTEVPFSTMARYVNWLHNDKTREAWAFEDGAYDMSTFTANPDGTRNDQLTHHPGARFWIPTYDEIIKSFYYDPNRDGPNQGGYWLFPNSSNEPLISGAPGIGTTNAGTAGEFGFAYLNAGSYPDTKTPWGLLDASGGESEMTETVFIPEIRARAAYGSSFGTPAEFLIFDDRIDYPGLFLPADFFSRGFRVASSVPTPVSTAAFAVLFAVGSRYKRRRNGGWPDSKVCRLGMAGCPKPRSPPSRGATSHPLGTSGRLVIRRDQSRNAYACSRRAVLRASQTQDGGTIGRLGQRGGSGTTHREEQEG